MNYGIEVANQTAVPAALSFSVPVNSSTMNVCEIDPLSDSRWEVLVSSHPQASVFHSTRWLRALQTAYGYEPVVITTCSRGTALTNGLVFCRIKSWLTGRRLVSLPFSDHCEPLAGNPEEVDNLLFDMRQHVDAGKWKYVEIRPTCYEPGVRTGLHKSLTYRIHRLDLGRSKQELFEQFHKSCVQRNIRRAEREKLHYEEGRSENLLRKFHDLVATTRRRQCLPPQPQSWFRALIDAFRDDLKIRVASKDGLPIASILTLSHKKSMVYKYGASDVRFHRFGGMALLFWNTIQEAKDKGLEELELGRSDSDNLGLISFKEHWGAVGKPLNYWAYPHSPPVTPGSWEKALLRQIVPMSSDPVLKTVGKLLYRHIG
jgi:Acetyltransferase (GNAT) domain